MIVPPFERAIYACAGVDVRSYRVIYDMVDDLRALMEGKLAPTEERLPQGSAEVRAVFGSGSRVVAGCMVTDGSIRKGSLAVVRPFHPFAAGFTFQAVFRSEALQEQLTEVHAALVFTELSLLSPYFPIDIHCRCTARQMHDV